MFRTVTSLDCPQVQGVLTRSAAAADGRSCQYAGPDDAAVTLQIVSITNGDVDAALAPIEMRLRTEVPSATAGVQGGAGRGKVDIDLPGIHIHASGRDGDQGGQVSIGRGLRVDAQDKGAEVRVDEGHGGVQRDYVLASDNPGPDGYRVAAYIAHGPKSGPLVVASMLVKTDDHGGLDHDIRTLVARNVGHGEW